MRFLADENFRNAILRGVSKKNPEFDVIRVQDTDVYQADDPTVLAWAAKENRIVLTHDVETMAGYAYERVRAGLPMPGVVEVREKMPMGQAINELLILVGASDEDELTDQVIFLPMR